LEFAAVLVEADGTVTAMLSALVAIDQPVPPVVVAATGITDAMVAEDGIPLAAAMESFLAFICPRPVFIHHAAFDLAFLVAAEQTTQRALDNVVYDTLPVFVHEVTTLSRPRRRAIDWAMETLARLLATRRLSRH
jgi:DNA polymerase-3 subunit epsilon